MFWPGSGEIHDQHLILTAMAVIPSLLTLFLLLCTFLPTTNALGLRRQTTHSINELEVIKKKMALLEQLKTSGIDVQEFASFALKNSAAPPPTSIDAPRFLEPTTTLPTTTTAAAATTTTITDIEPTTRVARPPALLPNNAANMSRSAFFFPSKCSSRPQKKQLTAEDVACMTKHSATTHGRYTCPINCPIGSPLSPDQTKCICGPCWEGTTCQTPKCAHGEKVGCPNHGTHCRHNERICSCPIDSSDGNPSYTGKHCEHAFDSEAMPASDVARKMEAQAAVDRAAADEAAALAAKAEKPCDGMKCDDDDVLSSSSSSMLNMMLNTTSCECVCSPPFMGAACDMCPTCSSPLHVPDLDNNCECSCADQNMTCQNEGWLNKETCTCSCVNHFSGKECNICEEKICENNGEFNKDLCSCLCPKGWKGKSCGECDEEATCDNGGRRNMDTCSCECNQDQLQKNLTTHWKGDFCEVSCLLFFLVFILHSPPPLFFTVLTTIESNHSPRFFSHFHSLPPHHHHHLHRRALLPTLLTAVTFCLSPTLANAPNNVNQSIACTKRY